MARLYKTEHLFCNERIKSPHETLIKKINLINT